jgi:hypothetical protein
MLTCFAANTRIMNIPACQHAITCQYECPFICSRGSQYFRTRRERWCGVALDLLPSCPPTFRLTTAGHSACAIISITTWMTLTSTTMLWTRKMRCLANHSFCTSSILVHVRTRQSSLRIRGRSPRSTLRPGRSLRMKRKRLVRRPRCRRVQGGSLGESRRASRPVVLRALSRPSSRPTSLVRKPSQGRSMSRCIHPTFPPPITLVRLLMLETSACERSMTLSRQARLSTPLLRLT